MSALRSFVVTERTYIGWALEEVVEGDLVVLFSRSTVPYFLRPINRQETREQEAKNNSAEPQTHQYIGDAYIHGIVDCECWDPDKLQGLHLI
jgi:hypothetical protein